VEGKTLSEMDNSLNVTACVWPSTSSRTTFEGKHLSTAAVSYKNAKEKSCDRNAKYSQTSHNSVFFGTATQQYTQNSMMPDQCQVRVDNLWSCQPVPKVKNSKTCMDTKTWNCKDCRKKFTEAIAFVGYVFKEDGHLEWEDTMWVDRNERYHAIGTEGCYK